MIGYLKFGLFVLFAGYAFSALLTAPFALGMHGWQPFMLFLGTGIVSAAPATYLFLRWLYPKSKARRNRHRQRATVRA